MKNDAVLHNSLTQPGSRYTKAKKNQNELSKEYADGGACALFAVGIVADNSRRQHVILNRYGHDVQVCLGDRIGKHGKIDVEPERAKGCVACVVSARQSHADTV